MLPYFIAFELLLFFGASTILLSLFEMQGSKSVHEVIYLFDDESLSVGFCQCDVSGLPRRVVLALPTVPLCFPPVPFAAPPSPPLDSSRAARAAYMHAWHARVHEARIRARVIAHNLPKRLLRLARTLE